VFFFWGLKGLTKGRWTAVLLVGEGSKAQGVMSGGGGKEKKGACRRGDCGRGKTLGIMIGEATGVGRGVEKVDLPNKAVVPWAR